MFLTTGLHSKQGLENRLKYSQKDLETSKKSIATYERKLTDFEVELNGVAVSFRCIELHFFWPNSEW